MIKILTLIKRSLPALLAALVLAGLAGLTGWNMGWRSGSGELADVQRNNRDLSMQVTNYERGARIAAEQNAQQLAAALEQQAQQHRLAESVTAKLRAAQRQLDAERRRNKQRVSDAVKNDSAAYSGIGPDSLRTYRASLGYAPDDQYLFTDSAATAGGSAETSSTVAGLSPEDLLSHAADYGAWCQSLERQLRAIENWQERKK